MIMVKELATRLLDAIEQLYIENLAYQSLFEVLQNRLPPKEQVKSLIEQAKQHPQLQAKVRQQFQPLRDRIRNEADLGRVLQEFLRVVPAKKDVN